MLNISEFNVWKQDWAMTDGCDIFRRRWMLLIFQNNINLILKQKRTTFLQNRRSPPALRGVLGSDGCGWGSFKETMKYCKPHFEARAQFNYGQVNYNIWQNNIIVNCSLHVLVAYTAEEVQYNWLSGSEPVGLEGDLQMSQFDLQKTFARELNFTRHESGTLWAKKNRLMRRKRV